MQRGSGRGRCARTAPPPLPVMEVPRAITSSVLGKLLDHSLVTICWPAGSGKTTFMARLRAEVELVGRVRGGPCPRALIPFWYRCEPSDDEPATLAGHLGKVLDCDAVGGPETLALTLREALAAFPGELIVFLDDYHRLDPAGDTCRLLHLLVNPAPANLRLCVASRRPLPAAPFRFNGMVWELPAGEAAFSLDETRTLAAKGYGLELSPDQAERLHQRTGGWVAGLHLMARWLRERLPAGAGEEPELPPAVEDYFAAEVLKPLPAEQREFLIRTGILRRLEPAFLDGYLETPGSSLLLPQLVAGNVFLSPRPRGYAYHPLFAAFLQRELSRQAAPAEVHWLHRHAGDLWARDGNLEEAAHHYVQAGAWQALAGLCARVGEVHLDRGEAAVVASCLDALPPGAEDRDPRLLLCRARLTGSFDPARTVRVLERAAGLFTLRLDHRGLVRALLYLGAACARLHRLADVRRVARRLAGPAALVRDRSLRGALAVWACGRAVAEDRLDRGMWLARQAARLPLDPGLCRQLAHYEAFLLLRRGRLEAAERAARREPPGAGDLALADASALLAPILALKGDRDAALQMADDLRRLAGRCGSAYHLAVATRELAGLSWREGRLEEAMRLFTESLEAHLAAGDQAAAAITRLELCLLRVTAGGPAAPAYAEGRSVFAQLRQRQGGPALEDLGLTLLGCLAREAGDLAQAEQWLQASLQSSLDRNAPQAATGTEIQLAALYLATADHERAREHLTAALGRARYHGYCNFAEWHGPSVLRVSLHALSQGIEPLQAAAFIGRWFARDEALPGLLAAVPAASRQAVEDLLEEIPADRGSVHVRLLGGFEVEADGRTVPESSWRTRKVRGILKHLVLRGGQPVSREHLMELFWPDADQPAAAASLRVALSSLRHALQGAGITHLVESAGDAVRFVPSPDVWVDVHRFQEAAQAGLAAARENSPAALAPLREAQDLYRGDLLPGDADEEWTLLPRQHLRQLREDVLVTLADLLLEQGELAAAAGCCREVLAENPFREDVYLRLMNVYRDQNRASEAIQVYHQCLTQLRAHLGVDPAPPLQALFGELLG